MGYVDMTDLDKSPSINRAITLGQAGRGVVCCLGIGEQSIDVRQA